MIEKIISQLGCSIHSDELKAIVENLKLTLDPKFDYDWNGQILNAEAKCRDFILTFRGYKRFKLEFGEARKIVDENDDELILVEIDFDNWNGKLSRFSIGLPFGLVIGDTDDSVIQKIEKKPKEKSTADYGFAWWFYFEDYRVLTALNKQKELIWLRIMLLDETKKKQIALKKELRNQRKNIIPKNAGEILALQGHLPTEGWRTRLHEGDTSFTEKGIAEVELVLKEYLDNLSRHTENKKASNIYNLVKKTTFRLNKLNESSNLIETLEREELCEFINSSYRMSGFKIEDDFDITEEWREW